MSRPNSSTIAILAPIIESASSARAGSVAAILSINPDGNQPRAQLFFAPRHLSLIALMIVAPQMQESVQHKNLHFFCREWPRARAFCVAISAEIAISPANSFRDFLVAVPSINCGRK